MSRVGFHLALDWNLTPWRSLKVTCSPSGEIVQDSASPGITFDPPISISTSRSAICSLTSKLVLLSVSAEFRKSGLASEHTVKMSARAPVAAKAAAMPAAIHIVRMASLPKDCPKDFKEECGHGRSPESSARSGASCIAGPALGG